MYIKLYMGLLRDWSGISGPTFKIGKQIFQSLFLTFFVMQLYPDIQLIISSFFYSETQINVEKKDDC